MIEQILQNLTYNMTIAYIAVGVALILLGVLYIAHKVSKNP